LLMRSDQKKDASSGLVLEALVSQGSAK
jgi:hypothetical protein